MLVSKLTMQLHGKVHLQNSLNQMPTTADFRYKASIACGTYMWAWLLTTYRLLALPRLHCFTICKMILICWKCTNQVFPPTGSDQTAAWSGWALLTWILGTEQTVCYVWNSTCSSKRKIQDSSCRTLRKGDLGGWQHLDATSGSASTFLESSAGRKTLLLGWKCHGGWAQLWGVGKLLSGTHGLACKLALVSQTSRNI